MASPADLLAAGLGDQPEPVPDPADLAALLPDYEVGPLLGRGAMGAVYRARHRELERTVALKVLLFYARPAAVARFRTEARALARLDHPHIVRIFDVGESQGVCWLAMEFIDGTDLRRAMTEKRLAPADILALVPQVCAALQYAHDQGVVHRDIKPENLLIDRAGQVHIADFGLAQLADPGSDGPRLTASGVAMGTPHYMAPEQVERPLAVDHRADLYALGVVLYELLTGELPLGRFAPPSRKVAVDVRLDEVVLRALEKEPERRYQQARQLGSSVERIARRPARRRWPVVTGIAAAFLLIAGVAAPVLWRGVSRPPPAADAPLPQCLPSIVDGSVPEDRRRDPVTAEALALLCADDLQAGRHEAVMARFDPTMSGQVDAPLLAAAWALTEQQCGTPIERGTPISELQGAVRVVTVPLRGPKGTFHLVCSSDAGNRIVGLWLRPGATGRR